MSALGQKQTHAQQQKGSLFDNFVDERDQCRSDFEGESLSGLEIEHQLEFG